MLPSLPFACLFYTAGLIVSFYLPVPFQLTAALFFITGAISLILSLKSRLFIAESLFIFAFCTGLFMAETPYLHAPRGHLEHFKEQRITFLARVIEPPSARSDGMRMKTECMKLYHKDMQADCSGTTLVYAKEKKRLQAGDIVRISGKLSSPLPSRNPGEFSFQTYLLAKGIRVITYADFIKKLKQGNPFSFKRLSFSLRDAFLRTYEKTLPHPYDAMLSAFIFGAEASEIPRDMEENFRTAGIIHLMVASGAQIALLLGVCLLLNKLLLQSSSAARAATGLLSFLFILSYTFMTQGGFSILRAFIMGCVLLLSVVTERDYDALNALFFSALLLLVLHPLAILDAGFQLSFAATFGIIYLSPKIYAAFKTKFEKPARLVRVFALLFSATLSAQLFVTPFLLFYFSGISAFSLLTNFIALPVAGALVPLGFLTGLIGILSETLAKIPASFCGFFLYIILITAQTAARFRYAFIECARPPVLFYISYYFVIFYFFARERFLKAFPVLTPARTIVLVLTLNLLPFLFTQIYLRPLKVTFFDIGQGDSALIETPDGTRILIDGGGASYGQTSNPGERTLVPYMRREGIRRLDLVILTHPHRDHLEGLLAVLNERHVNRLLYSSLSCDQPFCNALQSLIQNKKIKTLKAARGMKFAVGQNVTLTVLHPDNKPLSDTQSDIDNNSVAVLMEYKNVRFLFPGDVYKDGEESMLRSALLRPAAVLKVPHHGSRHSSTLTFLRMLKPRVAVISCGRRNVFRHPSKEALKNLELSGTRIYRTDTSGAVIMKTDGEKLWAETMY